VPGKKHIRMKRALPLLLLLATSFSFAQNPNEGLWQSLFANMSARSLGPTTMGGRVADLAVYEKEPRIFYVASASGGLWRTDNGGMTFKVVFDKENTVCLGAAAVDQNNPDVVWVGTGEGNSRNSTAWGDGVYKTTDAGKTWTNMGLRDTHHVSRIVIHPKDPNTVFIGALGHLWGPNEERGLYKTTDGGKSWKRVLYVDNRSGIIDVTIDPSNPNNMLCASYERMRFPYNYISGGKGSHLWKSTDGGNTWKMVTKGLPVDKGEMGRIGISYFRKNSKIVIATIEHSYPKPTTERPDARAFELAGTYKSTDGGESWTRSSGTNPRPFYFSEPVYDPSDEQRIYVPAVNLHYSTDGGTSFRVMQTSVHVDHHAMWVNPNDPNHLIIGQDGGVGQSRDRGATWEHLNYMPLGQFYAVTYDMRKPYYVYGGLQDNGSWGGPTQTLRGGVSHFDWYGIGGGDGFHVQVDPNDWTTVYSESQGGAIGRIDQTGKTQNRSIRPPNPNRQYRFNWSSPIYLSPHNSKTVYFGGNVLFKSVNRGDNWKAISPDLTTNDPTKLTPGKGSVTPENTGAEAHCTIITIGESPTREGVLWVGTDDGLVHVTQDGGNTWTNVTANVPDLPKNTWCSRVTPSRYEAGRCYATFDGHRSDDFNAYVYVTEDFGKTWKKLNAGIPKGDCAYVIKEGEKNPNLLFLGTEVSMWVSLNRGENWSRFRSGGFPTVAVHDVVIHPRELDLIIGTHGRSIWIMNISALEEMTTENLEKDVHLAKPQNVYFFGRVSGSSWEGDRIFVSPNTQPGTQIAYYLKSDVTGDAEITISDPAGGRSTNLTGGAKKGLNVVNWNGRVQGRVQEGDYRVTLKVGGKEYYTTVRVEDATKS
jgi:photosystem II stability/assembly factor-like uncharacterized protein